VQGGDLGAHHAGDGPHDRRVQLVRLERGVHGLAELVQVTEELDALREPLAVPPDDERGGEPIGDRHHQPQVAGVELTCLLGLDVEEAEELAVRHERYADLARGVRVDRDVVGIDGDVRDQRRPVGPHDAAGDAVRGIEGRAGLGVPAPRAERDLLVVAEIDRDVGVAELLGDAPDHLVERFGCRAARGEDVADGLHACELAGAATIDRDGSPHATLGGLHAPHLATGGHGHEEDDRAKPEGALRGVAE
jgi:hypothetical protein